MAVNIKPFRILDEHDVLPFFKFVSGSATKGLFVKLVSGFDAEFANLSYVTDPNAQAYTNTVSPRWVVNPSVTATTSGDRPLGMLLYDVKERDENSQILAYNPNRAYELQCVLSGQALPIATKGVFHYSGVGGTVLAGMPLYASANGELSVSGAAGTSVVGYTLGPKDAKSWTLIKIDL